MKKRMSVVDSFWLWIESRATPMQVAGLLTFEPTRPAQETIAELYAAYRDAPAVTKPFTFRMHRHRAPIPATCEVVDDVDIDYHLRHSALPHPGGERALGVLVSRLHSTPLDQARPMWETHLIEGLTGGRFALYVKTHHSLLDGVAGARVITETLSPRPVRKPLPPPWARAVPSLVKKRPRAGVRSVVGTGRTVAAALRGVARIARARSSGGALVGPFQAPASKLNVPITAQRRVATATVELDRVKAIAATNGVTLNDVVLALCSAALRRYLLGIDALPSRPLIANCPVSVRPADSDGLGNAISLLFANLATDVADPAERLRVIAASTAAGKAHLATMSKPALDVYSVLVMGPQLLRQLVPGLGRRLPPMYNLVISNVPGPSRPLYAADARMTGFFPVSLLFKGEALNITAMSYAGNLHFGFTAARDALPHIQDIALFLQDAVAELEDAARADARYPVVASE